MLYYDMCITPASSNIPLHENNYCIKILIISLVFVECSVWYWKVLQELSDLKKKTQISAEFSLHSLRVELLQEIESIF